MFNPIIKIIETEKLSIYYVEMSRKRRKKNIGIRAFDFFDFERKL